MQSWIYQEGDQQCQDIIPLDDIIFSFPPVPNTSFWLDYIPGGQQTGPKKNGVASVKKDDQTPWSVVHQMLVWILLLLVYLTPCLVSCLLLSKAGVTKSAKKADATDTASNKAVSDSDCKKYLKQTKKLFKSSDLPAEESSDPPDEE